MMKMGQVQLSKNSGKIFHCFKGRSRQLVADIITIIDEMEKYHPLTVRQIYYQLVAREIIANNRKEYQNISRLLTRMREEHLVPWSAIVDRSRRMVEKRGTSSIEDHIRENAAYLFDGYNRCLVQNQENYVEVWTEKDALSSIFEDAVWKYCCRIVVCRGQISATFLNEYAERAEAAIKRGQEPVILYYGDLDPTGMRIPEIIGNKLIDRYGLVVNIDRIALWPEDVDRHNLPFNPDATKKADPNHAWYCSRGYGDYSVELDALHPETLINIIDDALRDHLDIDDMICQQDIQEDERLLLKRLKLKFFDICRDENLHV